MRSISRRLAIAGMVGIGPALALDRHDPAPKFWAKTMDGERLDNESLKGKVVLLQFWTTWCQYCRHDQDAIESIIGDYQEKGLLVVGVNVGESKKKVQQYLEQYPRSCKIVLTQD